MNDTTVNPNCDIPNLRNEYIAIALGALLLISEVMPMLKKYKSNGLVHSIICLLKGSSCVAEKLVEIINIDDEETKLPDV
jgi:hypothetical protein